MPLPLPCPRPSIYFLILKVDREKRNIFMFFRLALRKQMCFKMGKNKSR